MSASMSLSELVRWLTFTSPQPWVRATADGWSRSSALSGPVTDPCAEVTVTAAPSSPRSCATEGYPHGDLIGPRSCGGDVAKLGVHRPQLPMGDQDHVAVLPAAPTGGVGGGEVPAELLDERGCTQAPPAVGEDPLVDPTEHRPRGDRPGRRGRPGPRALPRCGRRGGRGGRPRSRSPRSHPGGVPTARVARPGRRASTTQGDGRRKVGRRRPSPARRRPADRCRATTWCRPARAGRSPGARGWRARWSRWATRRGPPGCRATPEPPWCGRRRGRRSPGCRRPPQERSRSRPRSRRPDRRRAIHRSGVGARVGSAGPHPELRRTPPSRGCRGGSGSRG